MAVREENEMDIFFARPYHSWERGANENTNGLVRQYFLKGTDFARITDKDIYMVQEKINNRPIKRLNFKTPVEFIKHKYGDNKTIIKMPKKPDLILAATIIH